MPKPRTSKAQYVGNGSQESYRDDLLGDARPPLKLRNDPVLESLLVMQHCRVLERQGVRVTDGLLSKVTEYVRADPANAAREAFNADEAANVARRTSPRTIYYLRVGDLIKIGQTKNLDRRLGAYPPGSAILATEEGPLSLETRRHAQFAGSLAYHREWFHPTPDLLTLIRRLNTY